MTAELIRSPLVPWIAFNAAVLLALAIDLGFFSSNKKLSVREAALRSAVWVSLALAFAVGIFYVEGRQAGVEFITGYLVEYSLSIDNIFVMVLIFSYFDIREGYQHRVLFWGILGALVMRGLMIAAGAALFSRFDVDHLRLRRISCRHRDKDGRPGREARRSRQESGSQGRAPSDSRVQ